MALPSARAQLNGHASSQDCLGPFFFPLKIRNLRKIKSLGHHAGKKDSCEIAKGFSPSRWLALSPPFVMQHGSRGMKGSLLSQCRTVLFCTVECYALLSFVRFTPIRKSQELTWTSWICSRPWAHDRNPVPSVTRGQGSFDSLLALSVLLPVARTCPKDVGATARPGSGPLFVKADFYRLARQSTAK